MNRSVMLAVFLLGVSVIVLCSCEIINIVPADSTERCEAEPCYIADQCAMAIENHNFSDLTLYFLQGEHFFSRGLVIDSIDNVKMMGSSLTEVRFQNSGLVVHAAQNLVIKNLILMFSEIMPYYFKRIVIEKIDDVKVENLTVVMVENSLDKKSDLNITFNCGSILLKRCVFSKINIFNILTSNGVTIVGCSFNSIGDYRLVSVNESSLTNYSTWLGTVIKLYVTNCNFTAVSFSVQFINNMNISFLGCVFTNSTFSCHRFPHYTLMPKCEVLIKDTVITNNLLTRAVVSTSGSLVRIQNTTITKCIRYHVSLFFFHSTLILRQVTFNHNIGSIYLFDSKMNITGPVTLSYNFGGAIAAILSQIIITSNSRVVISKNSASSGGGILMRESMLVVQSPIELSYNRAEISGGGIYAYQSVIEFSSESVQPEKSFIFGNSAGQNGGGVYAVASTIKLSFSAVALYHNIALLGGGIYLQENSKIYLLKKKEDFIMKGTIVQLQLFSNKAMWGGGIYVADNTTAGSLQCQRESIIDSGSKVPLSTECFIQTLKLYTQSSGRKDEINLINTYMTNNTAELGSAIYGGLLDRCTVSTFAEANDHVSLLNGSEYIKSTVMISDKSSITSDPVQVVLCDERDRPTVSARKGETFKIRASAIDQVGNPVNATIHSSVVTGSGVGRLKEGQTEQRVGNQCTELEYNVFSEDSSAQVELYADGPCTNFGISRKTFSVEFLPCICPVGLQPSRSRIQCECVCDKELQSHHIINCSQQAGTIQLVTNIWIGVVNSTTGTEYVIHDCPFDYCVEKPVNIKLNSSQERDRQCTFNRSGILCGQCQQGLSLLFATSKCQQCSNIYLLLLLPFGLAGVALVAFILFFNITIATGTVHGLIIYSNLLTTNLLTQPNALSVFISWVHLDLGIETCLYNGMSSQAKVLLQLVFPAYLFLLMFLIIIISRYSNFFATLLSNRNPVAALCTLVFMTYTKLVRFIIAALQSTVLDFPEGLKQRVWVFDSNVQYFTSSHAPRFIAAVLILIAGGLFTLQLLFAQCFPRYSKWKFLKWTRNTKYTAFMDAFHAPFTRKHRYWVGLLLFALIVHSVVSAMATDDFLPVLSMGCTAVGLIVIKLHFNKGVYRDQKSNVLDSVFLLNLIFLAIGTLYARTTGAKNIISTLANVSMGLSACLFLIIICYHSYKYVYLQSKFYRRHRAQIVRLTATFKKRSTRQDGEKLDKECTLDTQYTAMRSCGRREPDLDALAPITTDDYKPAPPPCKAPSVVTRTVINIEKASSFSSA